MGVVGVVVNRSTTALFLLFVLVHGVLKRLHHPLWKNVMLLHIASSWHAVLHCSIVDPFPGDVSMYSSPAPSSHWMLGPTGAHLVLAGLLEVAAFTTVVVVKARTNANRSNTLVDLVN